MQLVKEPSSGSNLLNISASDSEMVKNGLNSNILLSDIARTLITSTTIGEKLNAILSLTGKALNVSRVYIFEDDLQNLVTNNTYEWCNDGVYPVIDTLQGVPFEVVKEWYDIIGTQGYISAHDIQQLPSSIIKVLDPQGIISIIVFKLNLPEGGTGFVGFDECREHRHWSEYEIDVLQAINGIITSIYENEYLTKKLHDSTNNFYNMFNSITDFMFVADLEGYVIEGNAALQERTIFRMLKNQGKRVHIFDMHPVKYREEVKNIIAQMQKGDSDTCNLPILGSDGFEIEVNTKVWKGSWDNKEVFLGISKDISKEVVALEMFNKLFDNNPLPVLVVDVERRCITRINNSFEEVFGYTIEDLTDLDIADLYIWPDQEYAKIFLEQFTVSQNMVSNPVTLKRKNGQLLSGVTSSTSIVIHGKNQVTAVFTDLSEQIELQERLAEQKQRLEHIITSSEMGTWEWDLETNETIFNEKWAEMVGYRLEDLEPTTIQVWRNLLHPADISRADADLAKYFQGKGPYYSNESRMLHRDGSYRWIYDTGKVVEYTSEGKPKKMFGSHLDITKIKMTEQQLFEAKQKAEKESINKSQFLANVSHEIRTPIHTMQGITELLAKTALTDKQKTYALYLQQSSNILLETVNNILDFTKIEANKVSLHNQKFFLNDIVDSIINLFAFRFAQKELALFVDVDPLTPLDLFGDYHKLSQILQNLLSNAEKFTPEGSVTLKIEPLNYLAGRVDLKFSVTDTGYGIDANLIEKIFDSYVQDHKLMAKNVTVGSGLGLFIVKQLVGLLNGEIGVDSTINKGSTFSVTLPFAVNSDFNTKLIFDERLTKQNFQIVVDEGGTGEIIKRAFKKLDLRCGSIEQAISREASDPIIAIIDWESAIRDRRIKSIEAKLEASGDKVFFIVLSSVMTLEQEIRQILGAKLLHIIRKPVYAIPLLNVIIGFLNVIDSVSSQDKIKIDAHNGALLLVEDHAINREITYEILHAAGYEVDCAETGESALEKLKNRLYDVVLLDIQLPDIDGFEVARRIRTQLNSDVPITALSAHAQWEYEKKGREVGINNYLSKPVSPTSLYRAIDSLIFAKGRRVTKEVRNENIGVEFEDLGIDFNAVMERYQSKIAIYYKHVKSFTIELNSFLTVLKTGSVDKKTILSKLHSLKGVGANLGMTLLRESIATLEEEITKVHDSTAVLPQIVESLLNYSQNAQALLEKLKPYLEGGESESQVDYTGVAVDVEQFCDNLRVALKIGDIEQSIALVQAIRSFAKTEPYREEMAQMLSHIENYDFLDAESILEGLCVEIAGLGSGL